MDAFYRGRQARDLGIKRAAAAGMAVQDIAQVAAIDERRVSEIIGPQPLTEAKAAQVRTGCSYCHNTGRVDSARACGCKRTEGRCERFGCDDGWIYVYDFCDRCSAGTAR